MSLKRLDIKLWLFFCLAIFCLTVGFYLYTSYSPISINNEQETEYATMENSTEYCTTEATTEFASEYETEALLHHDSEYVAETSKNSEVFIAPGTSPVFLWLGYGLLLVGAVFAILFLRFHAPKRPLLGPEIELWILSMLPKLFWHYRFMLMQKLFLWLPFLLAALLLCLRSFLGWFLQRCSNTFFLSYRVGMAFSKKLTRPEYFLLTQALFCLTFSLAACFLGTSFPLTAFTLLFSACLPFYSLWKYGQAIGKLQVSHEEAIRTAVISERFKVELISNVSHDLRTPLTSILGYGELLQQEQLSPIGQQHLAQLNLKAGYMKELVESLFELTKVQSGIIEPQKDSIDLIRLLEQTIGLFDDQLTEAGLLVRRHYAKETILLVTDGSLLHQVFANLLGNAIKYALSGSRIHLEAQELEESYSIRMTNTASYELNFQPEEILQRFARGDKARSTKGSGIGLAIAQTYTEAVGGQFHVAIDYDQFSAIVTLPK